jgi:hypothetical protein
MTSIKQVDSYLLLELTAGVGACKCMRFLAEFLHCPVTGVALQLAVRGGCVELVRDLRELLERAGALSESVIRKCACAAIAHCRGATLAWLLQDADSATLEEATGIAIQGRKASPTRRLPGVGVHFQNVEETAGWPTLYRAVYANVDTAMPSLLHAVIRGAADVVVDLIKNGAAVNRSDPGGQTGLLFIATYPDPEWTAGGATGQPRRDVSMWILAILVGAGADVDQGWTEISWTPLHVAVEFGCVSAAESLVAAQANVDALETDVSTPLHLASKSGNVKIQ